MASPFQQQARQRKLFYGAAILVLFSAAWAWRHYVVDDQARALALYEEQRGEVDLLGSVIRLGFGGSRGLASCWLAIQLHEKQKRNQYNELEVLALALTKLQPHFITPWLFQSWNLSYNVSVEADRVADKYFYIGRGIQLLANGQRQNLYNPDLRWTMGFYTHHKLAQSDETNTLRSLFQLSCIPPNQRDPARFRKLVGGKQELNIEEFQRFCREHPQLVRRLKEGMRRELEIDRLRQFTADTPEKIVQFLADNYQVLSVYEDTPPAAVGAWQEKPDKRQAVADRFPVLPPPPETWGKLPSPRMREGVLHINQELQDSDDPYAVSRGWYVYAQEPVPDPDELPGSTRPVTDRTKQRRPRYMMTVIFRAYPAQAARFMAERLQDEGWFDESGWALREADAPGWEKLLTSGPMVLGNTRPWTETAWALARDLWHEHGVNSHLLFEIPAEQKTKEDAAKMLYKDLGLRIGSPLPPNLRRETLSPEAQAHLDAYQFMNEYERARTVSNFPHHYARALVEADKTAVKAHKLFFEAETLRLAASPIQALEKYESPDALAAWRDKVLLKNREFRRDTFNEEEAFTLQMRYMALYNEQNGYPFHRQAATVSLVPLAPGGGPAALAAWLAPILPQRTSLVKGPFDGVDEDGVVLIPDHVRDMVLDRHFPGHIRGSLPRGPAGPRPGSGPARGPRPSAAGAP